MSLTSAGVGVKGGGFCVLDGFDLTGVATDVGFLNGDVSGSTLFALLRDFLVFSSGVVVLGFLFRTEGANTGIGLMGWTCAA